MGNIAVVTNMAVVIFSTSENAFRFQWAQDNPVWTFLIAEVCACVPAGSATKTPSWRSHTHAPVVCTALGVHCQAPL